MLASPDESEVYHKKMSAINEILLPVLLFAIYFFIAIQFLPQPATVKQPANPVMAILFQRGYANETEAPATTLEEAVNCSQLSIAILQKRDSAKVNSDAVISRDWLETQSLANLKAIAAELCITPIGDKRSKLTWINAIVTTTPENTVLAVNLCYA